MAREEADTWFREAFDVDVASLRQAGGGQAGGGQPGSGQVSGAKSDADASTPELMKQAAAKAKEEADAAAAAYREKAAALEQKRQAALAALHESEAKSGAEFEVETAAASEREADKIAPSKATPSGDPAAADLLQKAADKAKQEADAAGAKYAQAAREFDQADAEAQTAREFDDAKLEAEHEAEAAAESVNKASVAAPRHIGPDCKPVRDKVDGPKEHVLCGTHGHVYDEKTGLIIAESLTAYDAQHPVPRPVEADCKIVRGKMPNAPQSIVLCATHGHVIDEAKGQIVANTPRLYYRAHPAPTPPESTPTSAEGAKPKTATAVSPETLVGHLTQSVDAENDIERVILGVSLRASGDLEYSMSWNYADSPAGDAPASALEQLLLTNDVGDDLGAINGASHKVEPGKSYRLAGKRKLRPVDGSYVHVDAKIVADGVDRPLLALSGEFKITMAGV